jgi:hypothetical protein
MRIVNVTLTSLLLLLALSSCATPDVLPAPPSVIEVPGPRLRPPPDSVMQAQEPNFRQRLLDFFSPKPTALTPSSGSSEQPSE